MINLKELQRAKEDYECATGFQEETEVQEPEKVSPLEKLIYALTIALIVYGVYLALTHL